ncbi:alcohol dehydrogenase catalytic domain-containing protein [Marispirochaeta sp.]|uniref:alcohol dehydrogenase catalytic domain-containing protein n=1 Tax=Marispirochaeta sp. TaxID=2038653 RepID=UPI0029C6B676|nr:alcohol dehydrogenase catalytic domain-containing protein [Marispirochaeta sp.]
MKSVYVTAPYNYAVLDTEIPELKDDYEVLIQMKASGVCGSDFHLYHGKNPNSTYPRIPGHENAGIIRRVGRKVTKVKVGDHIVIDLIISCGECYQCRTGRENVCEKVKVRGSGTDGGWREFLIAAEDDVYIVPKDIPIEYAALIEPYAIGAHCTTRGRVVSDDIVFILGVGTIGTIIMQTCKAKGCTVIACDINSEILNRAEELGVDSIINSRNEKVVERVQEITGGKGVSVAFDSACYHGSLTSLFEQGLVRNAGRIVSLGFVTEPEKISQAMLNIRELDLIGSRMSAYQFMPTIEAFLQKRYDYEKLVSDFIPFSRIDTVFYNMDHPGRDVKKMIITFD